MSARQKLREEPASDESDEFEEDSELEGERLHHAAPGHVAGTHGVRQGRTHISSSGSLLKKKAFLGLSAPAIVASVAWLVFIAVALFKDLRRALPLAVLTAFCVLLQTGVMTKIQKAIPQIPQKVHLAILFALAVVAIVLIVLKLVPQDGERACRLQALLGTCVFLGLGALLSWNRPGIPWPEVVSAALLQFFLGLFVLSTKTGVEVFSSMGDAVTNFLDLTDIGCALVFGDNFKEHFFAFKVLPVTIFFSSFISTMYYLGIMQIVVRIITVCLKKLVGTSLIQSVNAAGNLFLGQTEAPLLIKPFLATATPCDLHCVMVGGFASIAGGVLAAYIGMGVSPSQLIGASVMSVPGTLLVSNIICPPGSMREEEVKRDAEHEDSNSNEEDDDDHFEFPPIVENNIVEAAGNGAHTAIEIVLNIGAMLIAFRTLIAALDGMLGYLGGLVDIDSPPLSFSMVCGYMFFPIAWLVGAPLQDCTTLGKLIGTKIFVNEFVAYSELSKLIADQDGVPLSDDLRGITHSGELTATYALCGFSNIGSIGIQLGCLSSICPSRSRSFAKLVVSAMLSGNVVCFVTATFATLLTPS